jgi:predicted Holliday junction resolvase-like endonuclease
LDLVSTLNRVLLVPVVIDFPSRLFIFTLGSLPVSPAQSIPYQNDLTDLLIPAIAFILGIIAAYLIFRQQISAIEERARNDLERWKLECTNDILKDSVNRSRSTLKGRISDQMAPLWPEFPFSSADARFIGNPIAFVVFDGYTIAKDDKGDTISVVLVEVKKGKGKLTREETLIKKAVEEGRVSWRTIFFEG